MTYINQKANPLGRNMFSPFENELVLSFSYIIQSQADPMVFNLIADSECMTQSQIQSQDTNTLQLFCSDSLKIKATQCCISLYNIIEEILHDLNSVHAKYMFIYIQGKNILMYLVTCKEKYHKL